MQRPQPERDVFCADPVHRCAVLVTVLGTLLLFSGSAAAQLPSAQLDGLYPLGASPGQSFELQLAGDDLVDVDRLLFSVPGMTAERKMVEPTEFQVGPQPVENTFVVRIADSVKPGRCEVRCQGRYGLSNSRRFEVSGTAATVEVEPNNDLESATPASAPAMIDGRLLENADVDVFRVRAAAGRLLVIDLIAQELDSPVQAVLSIADDRERILTEARATAGQDPSVLVTVPSSGTLLVKVHDAQFRRGEAYSYRIRLSERPQVDFIFPPAVEAGRSNRRTVFGRHLPNGKPTELTLHRQPLFSREVTIDVPTDAADRLTYSGRVEPHVAVCDGFEYRLNDSGTESNPLLVTVATAPIVHEQPDNDTPGSAQPLDLPCEVAGRFFPQRDLDWYSFDAKQGQQIAIELYSHRLGLGTDPAMLLQRVVTRDDGSQQVSDVVFLDDVRPPQTRNESGRHEFETSSSDPSYLFEVPEDGTYRLLVKDGYSSLHSDPRSVYRLVVRQPKPDFRIIAVPAESATGLQLRRGGREVVRVFAERREGFDGPIVVRVDGLPKGVTGEQITIGPGNRMGTLVLTADSSVQPGTAVLKVSAVATVDGHPVQHNARYGAASVPWRMGQPNSRLANVPGRLTDGIQLMVLEEEPAPAFITIGDGQPVQISRGMTVKIPYRAKKRDGVGGNLLAFPMDFPQNASAGQVNIGNSQKGEFDLRLNSNAPPGEHTIYLAGYLQNMPYRYNPEAVDTVKKQQEHVAKILDQANTDVQTTQQATRDTQNELNKSSGALNSALQARTNADQKRIAAKAQHEAALNLVRALEKQAKASADDEALQQKFRQAQQAEQKAADELATATTQLKTAAQELTLAEAAVKQATEAKTAADNAARDARTFQQQAQRERQRIDQLVRTTEQAARQRNINVNIPSNSLKVIVAEYPVKWEAIPPQTVTQGQSHEIKVRFRRLFDYKGNLSIQVQPPGGVAGISAGTVNLSGDKTEGVLKLNIAPTATPGDHVLTLRISLSGLSGSLIMEQPVSLKIKEAAKEA